MSLILHLKEHKSYIVKINHKIMFLKNISIEIRDKYKWSINIIIYCPQRRLVNKLTLQASSNFCPFADNLPKQFGPRSGPT